MTLSPPKRPPDDEQRLVVLYALRQFSPCTEMQLLQFLAEEDLMNYFDMMIALQDLCARGQAVRSQTEAGGYSYQPTPAGDEALSLFGGRVPFSVKKLLSETGGAWRARFAAEEQYPVRISQTERGDYEVLLSVREQSADTFRLTLTAPTRELALKLAGEWPAKAGKIYETVFRTLSEEAP